MRALSVSFVFLFLVACGNTGSDNNTKTEAGVLSVKPSLNGNGGGKGGGDSSSNTAPTVQLDFIASAKVGEQYIISPQIVDPDGDKVRLSTENLPSWLTLSRREMVLTGTPQRSDAGLYENIRLSVTDGYDTVWMGPFSILVELVNTPPQISGQPRTLVNEGESYVFMPDAMDAEGDRLGFEVINKPGWMSLDSVTGMLSGQPGYNDAGIYSDIQLSVSDGLEQTILGPFTIAVQDVNRPPIITSQPPISVTEGVEYRYVVLIQEPDGQQVNTEMFNAPSWMTFDVASSTLSGTPDFNAAGNYNGISISAMDSAGGKTMQTFDLSVVNYNRLPVANNIQLQVDEDSTGEAVLQASDPDGEVLSFSISLHPQHGSVSLSGNRVQYLPVQDFFGQDEMVYAVEDASGERIQASISIDVLPVDDVPVAAEDIVKTLQATPVDIAVLENDSGLGDQVNVSVSGLPGNGTVVAGENSSLIYTPNADFTGEDVFTYQLVDQDMDIATANVRVNVALDCGSTCSKVLQLSWSEVSSTDVKGYYIYHGTTPGQYVDRVWVGNVTQAAYEVTQSGTHYFVATTANLQDVESGYSNEAYSVIQ